MCERFAHTPNLCVCIKTPTRKEALGIKISSVALCVILEDLTHSAGRGRQKQKNFGASMAA